jgi:hypothetical protein
MRASEGTHIQLETGICVPSENVNGFITFLGIVTVEHKQDILS